MSNAQNTLAGELVSTAVKFPDRIALCTGNESYTFAQLFGRARNISGQIQRSAARVVAVHCDQTLATYASLVGVILSGRCYLPLSAQLPAARKKQIIDLCNPDIVLLPGETGTGKISNEVPVAVHDTTQTNAYILFTSGSTGQPKGVPVSFANLRGFLSYFDAHFDFSEHDRFLQPFDDGFDMSLFSILLAWRVGACVYAVPESGPRPLSILAAIRDHKITVAPLVPTILFYAERYLDEVDLRSLRYTFFAGDRLIASQALRWQRAAPECRIYNMYGPTEATIVCTAHRFDALAEREGDVPIGRVFDGTSFLLLDEQGHIVKNEGELCLAGAQVIKGYVNDVEPERFFLHDGKQYYRTGDKVILNKNAELEFAGRIDRQVKIQGHRVEPAEVERVLTAICDCRVVVVCVADRSSNTLVAFSEGRMDEDSTFRQLRDRLPLYMIPSRIIQIDELPLGPNEKIDRRRLQLLYHERFHSQNTGRNIS